MTAPATDTDRATELVRAKAWLAAHCPELRVGDVWHPVFGEAAQIVAFEEAEGDNCPWPQVVVRFERGQDAIGAPAFIHSELVTRGKGQIWTPPPAPPAEEDRP
jgi:hypothetical protein